MRKYIAYILLPFLLFSCSDRMEKSPAVSGGNGNAGQEEYDYNQGFSPMGGTQADPSENGLVVGDVVMPKSFAPCLRSDDLRLPMRGFSEGCNLKFKAKDGSEYTASVVDFDENGIIFNLPSEVMSGDYELYVERGDVRQNLGCRYIMCDTPAGTAGINVKGTVYISGKPASHAVIHRTFPVGYVVLPVIKIKVCIPVEFVCLVSGCEYIARDSRLVYYAVDVRHEILRT